MLHLNISDCICFPNNSLPVVAVVVSGPKILWSAALSPGTTTQDPPISTLAAKQISAELLQLVCVRASF